MKKIILPLLFTLLFFSDKMVAQQEANIWYFGEYAGLDFNSGTPVVLNNSAMSAFEGCASIADDNGDLLFYTDGMSVWNKIHQIMSNGTGLNGNSSSTQSGVIVPQPGAYGIYYLFTVDAQVGTYGFRYSIVDINLQGGLGDVIQKNIPVLGSTCEKIAAFARDDNSVWVVTHQWDTNNFYAYLLDASGLSLIPVISSAGTIPSGNNSNAIGYMKFSPDGNHLAQAIDWGLQVVELFDFDYTNGMVSNSKILKHGFPGGGPYGVEFSPNSNLLYGCNEAAGATSHVYQWNLLAGDSLDIVNSVMEIDSFPFGGALQIAPDGKIYLSEMSTHFLGVINSPDVIGTGCDFQKNAINLAPGIANFGLPNFNFSYFKHSEFSFNGVCMSDSFCFDVVDTTGVTSVAWNFDDPNSGLANTSSIVSPCHLFSDSGQHEVQFVKCVNFVCDTFYQTINVHSLSANSFYTGFLYPYWPIYFYANSVNAASWYWDFGDGTTSTLENPSHYYTTEGVFTVILTIADLFDCTYSDTLVLPIFNVGIERPKNEIYLSVIPNPFMDVARLSFSLPHSSMSSIELWNTLGQKVNVILSPTPIQYGNYSFDLTAEKAGMYYVKVTADDQVGWKKIIKLR